MDVTIRPLDREDKQGWLDLWQDYLGHYGENASAHLTFTTFDRLVNRDHPLRCRLAAEADGTPVGFIHYFVHESTWHTREVCFVEDVFVLDSHRRKGIAKAMVADVARVAGINNWRRMYMSVPGTDEQALGFFRTIAAETDWIVFDYKV